MSYSVPRIPGWVKSIYVGLVLLALVWVLANAVPQMRQWGSLFLKHQVYVFMACWAAMACLLGALWALLLRLEFNAILGTREWLGTQALAWGGRYLPGKVGLFVSKLGLSGRHGLVTRKLSYSVIWEQLAFVFSGAMVASLLLTDALPFGPSMLTDHWDALRAGTLILSPVLFLSATWFLRKRLFSPQTCAGMGVSKELPVLLLYVLPHLLIGFACYPLLLELIPQAASLGFFGVAGLLALANVAGILAVFAPAGVGVREAVLGFGLGAYAPLPEALAFAALLRILTLIADAGFFLLGGGAGILRR